MYICIHTLTYIHAYMHAYKHVQVHNNAHMQTYRVQGISRNYAQQLRREFQAPTPKIQKSPSAFQKAGQKSRN